MSAPSSAPASRRWVRVAQVVASVAVIAVLSHDVDLTALGAALRQTSLGLLALALAFKTVSIVLHEVRLWLALPQPRPPLPSLLSIGFTAGALNLVLPGRGGDLAAIAMINRELRIPAGAAAAAVAIASFLEAAVFGVLLLVVMVAGATRWELVVGHAAHQQAVTVLTLVTLGGIAAAVGTVIAGKLLSRRASALPGPAMGTRSALERVLGFVRDTITSTGGGLSDWRRLSSNTVLALVQVLSAVAAVTIALPAVGVHIPLPWLAASGVLAIASVAAVVLPPTYGAGPAAASVAVLAVFGVSQTDALAYAVLWWFIAQTPPVVFGLPAIWQRRLARPDGG